MKISGLDQVTVEFRDIYEVMWFILSQDGLKISKSPPSEAIDNYSCAKQ